MPIQMELRRIVISEVDDHQYVVLNEVGGERSMPIVVGIFEATSIDRRVRGQETPRPLTHDLIVSAIEQLGGEVQDMLINDLHEHTFFAVLRVRKDGELVEIDCRPSDALAVAVACRAPIFVNESVLGEALEDDE